MKLLVLSLVLSCVPSIFGLSIRSMGKRSHGYSLNIRRSSPLAGIPWDYDAEDVMAQNVASEQADIVVRLLQKIAELEAAQSNGKQYASKRGTLWSSLRGPLPLDARFNDGNTQDNADMARNLKTMRYGRK